MPEFPDWLRGLALIGYDGADYVVIAAKSTGELYTLIQGEYAGTPTTIAVDALGHMLAVLKGQFGGSLITVKVDSEGRLYSYVTDDIDQWGNILPGGFAELAARLGSPQAYERRGQVVFTDSFERGLTGWSVASAGGYTFALTPTDFIHGGYSVHLKSDIGASNYVQMVRTYGGFPANVGVGAAWWAKLYMVGDNFNFGVVAGDGTTKHTGRITGKVSDSTLYYYNSGGGTTAFGTWNPAPVDPNYFRFFKVAVDQVANEYLYAVVDGVQYDLTGIACNTAASTDRLYQGFFDVRASAGSHFQALVDSFVMTTMETAEHI